MTDAFVYDEALEDQVPEHLAFKKEMLMIQDSNGGSYNSVITIDTSSLSQSNRWISWREAYIEIPFMIVLKQTNASAANPVNPFSIGLKNGYHQLIDSIKVDFGNYGVTQQTTFTNFYVSYKMMTRMSQDELQKWGASIGFEPDSADSYEFSAASATSGDGYTNNRLVGAVNYNTPGDGANGGLTRRIANTTGYLGTGYGGIPAPSASQIAKNYFTPAAAVNGYSGWVMTATIRLADICDFFKQLNICKGGFSRIQIVYNASRCVLTSTAANTFAITSITPLTSGSTTPYIFTSAATANEPNRTFFDQAATVATIDCGVVTTPQNIAAGNLFQTPLTACRLYLPAYSYLPEIEKSIIDRGAVKEIVYEDIYSYTFGPYANSSSFNFILSNGVANVKEVILIPFASTASGVYANVTTNVWQSPLDTAPATTTPLAAITNFQVLLSGSNVFDRNQQYDFESFFDEVSSAGALNGGLSSVTCGLLSQAGWSNAYRYYVANISRRWPYDDGTTRSVAVQGTNVSGKALTFVAFIVYYRRVFVNLLTGDVVKPPDT